QPEMCEEVTEEEIVRALRGSKNYAAPGPDKIITFWWKKLPSLHRRLARIFNSWLNEEQPIPQWFVTGYTVLIPKKGDLSAPRNYRPITCLNTCYKLFTRVLYARLLSAVKPVYEEFSEQRGSKPTMDGC